MRILLALITVFAVFQAQAYCYIEGNEKKPSVTSETIILDLNAGSASKESYINLAGSSPNFKCMAGSWTSNTFNLYTANNTDHFYRIKDSIHNIVVKITLKAGTPIKSNEFKGEIYPHTTYSATELNAVFKYILTYSILSNYTGAVTDSIDINTPFELINYMIVKPTPCDSISCLGGNKNTSHEYHNRIKVLAKFTPTTCELKSKEISAPSISYHEIASNVFAPPTTQQPQIECSNKTTVATSNIHYHFEAISSLSGKTLQNELGAEPGSAGEIGFELKNNGQDITFQPTQKFTLASRGSTLRNNSTFPLNLQLRYARYGNKVFAGKVQSKVKVVVDYD